MKCSTDEKGVRQRLLFSVIPNGETWIVRSMNPVTDEFEFVCEAFGKVPQDVARQFVAAGKARWGEELGWPAIVLKSGKILLISYCVIGPSCATGGSLAPATPVQVQS